MLDQIMLLGNRFVVVSDFNVLGDIIPADPHTVDVFTVHPVRSASARHWSDTHQRQHVGPDPVARRTDI